MSIEYSVVHMHQGGDPIYMGIARRTWLNQLCLWLHLAVN